MTNKDINLGTLYNIMQWNLRSIRDTMSILQDVSNVDTPKHLESARYHFEVELDKYYSISRNNMKAEAVK